MVPPDSVRVSRVRTYSGAIREAVQFRLRDGCPLWFAVPRDSTTTQLCNSTMDGPTTPPWTNPRRFGLFPFRSPLLRESLLISFPRGTEMFQFPRFPLPALCVQAGVPQSCCGGFPHSDIRGSKAIQRLTAAYRSRSRPSSTLGAKASTVCPYYLDGDRDRNTSAFRHGDTRNAHTRRCLRHCC